MITTSVGVPIHSASGGSGDLNADGLQLTGRGNEGAGEQMGGMFGIKRVGGRIEGLG